MRSFEEVLLDAIEADIAAELPRRSSVPPSIDDAMQSMLTVATALELEVPAWARTIGVHFPCTAEELNRSFRQRALETHPDRPGGSHEAFLDTTRARDEGMKAICQPRAWTPVRYVR